MLMSMSYFKKQGVFGLPSVASTVLTFRRFFLPTCKQPKFSKSSQWVSFEAGSGVPMTRVLLPIWESVKVPEAGWRSIYNAFPFLKSFIQKDDQEIWAEYSNYAGLTYILNNMSSSWINKNIQEWKKKKCTLLNLSNKYRK